jgi:hypothetical protein
MLFIMCGQVLGLMVRMLGFSDEDKQRIGAAQQVAGKGVVRGVLGLPGRLVGGILGGGSAESPANAASENHVIFLSKDLSSDIYKNASCLISRSFCVFSLTIDADKIVFSVSITILASLHAFNLYI